MNIAEIQHLIDIWAIRPSRVEPDDADDQRYVFTRLLPALRDAMPHITSLIQSQEADSPLPNSEPWTAPSTEPSSHIPTEIPKTDGNGEVSSHTGGTSRTSASSLANAATPAEHSPGGTARAKPKQGKKHAGAPPSAPLETV